MPPRVKVNFHYDIGSSYSYFAYEILLRYEKLWNIDLQLTPILLGGVYQITGNTSPEASSRYKATYTNKDTQRVSQEIQVPYSHGPEFPGNTFMVMRMLRYLKDILPPEIFKATTRHYFRENFVVNTALSSPSFITSLSPSILPPEEMKDALIKFKDKSVTDAMKAEAAALVQDFGAFGFPWIVVTRNPTAINPTVNGENTTWFFGSDRFSNIAWWLGPEYLWLGPVPSKANL